METTSRIRGFPLPVKGSQRLLRYPVLFLVTIVVTFELIGYVCIRILVVTFEYIRHKVCIGENGEIYKNLQNAADYQEYIKISQQLDTLENRNKWKTDDESYCYDVTLVRDILAQMRGYINAKPEEINYPKLVNVITQVFHHCLGWFETEDLYSNTYYGTKNIVNTFMDAVIDCLEVIKNCDEIQMCKQEKINIFSNLQQSFGRTALCLSGGATMTFYQFGAIKLGNN